MLANMNRAQPSAAFLVLGIALAEILSFKPALGAKVEFAQTRGYSASGTHQCGSEKGHSCVVTGSGFTNCNDASIFLQTRDCCPTTAKAGRSSGFTLNYCIPDRVP